MFNVGFILFRKSDKVMALFKAWQDLTQRNFELGNLEQVPQIEGVRPIEDPERRRELLFMDQTSFVQLFSPQVNRFALDYEIMDEGWNFRSTGKDRVFAGPVKISHHPDLRKRLGDDIILRAQQYAQDGWRRLAREILQCLHDELVPAENVDARAAIQGLLAQV